jgi:hypothetical protein
MLAKYAEPGGIAAGKAKRYKQKSNSISGPLPDPCRGDYNSGYSNSVNNQTPYSISRRFEIESAFRSFPRTIRSNGDAVRILLRNW